MKRAFIRSICNIIFCLFIVNVEAQVFINQTISVDLEGVTSIEGVIPILEKKSGYTFAFGNVLQEPCNLQLVKLEAPLHDVLDEIFTPCNIDWNIIGEHIILTKLSNRQFTTTISGRIIDQLTREGIPFATVYIPNSVYGTSTDINGRYEIKGIKQSKFKLACSMMGYDTYQKIILVGNDSTIKKNITLEANDITLEAAIFRYDRISDQTTISKITLNKSDLDANLNISDDPLKAIAQLPSVAGNGDLLSSNELYIRGGEPNENLLLLDNVRFLWPYYLGGASVFNPDVLKDVEVMSGEFQSKYGNAMSGIINLTTRNGSTKRFKANVGFSGFHNSFLFEGPFKKHKSSYLVAFRKTNKLSFQNNTVKPQNSSDLNVKLFFQLSKNHRLSYSNITVVDHLNLNNLYIGIDSIRLPLFSDNRIGGQSLQWQAKFPLQIYNKFSIHQSDQKINLTFENGNYPTIRNLNNGHISIRNDLSVYLDPKIKLETGFEFNIDELRGTSKEIYSATDIQVGDSSLLYRENAINLPRAYIASYFNFDIQLNDQWRTIIGIRSDLSENKYYLTLSPRWNIAYDYNEELKFTGFVGLFRQNPERDSLFKLKTFKPNQVWQLNIGAQYKFDEDTYFWTEAYSKSYKNLVVYGPNLVFSNNGKAKAFGIELFAQREIDNLLMRLSYSLSYAERQRDFHHRSHTFHFDQRHRMNYFMKYIRPVGKFGFLPKYSSLNYRFTTGTPYTEVVGFDPDLVNWGYKAVFGDINQRRNRFYHNINLKFVWEYHLGTKRRTRMHLFLEYWNILNTQNLKKRIYTPDPKAPSNLNTTIQYHEGRIPNVGIKFWFNER